MTPKELEALAVYRTHLRCVCEDCILAREVLKKRDEKSWPIDKTI